ncbi:hypothetical protein RhiLY_04824 [Ceratobasidium sp. AG-Ba]|nr:hypothetical protein RhiLY_04824 [Ceratobasidium sp. AG-Ba]
MHALIVLPLIKIPYTQPRTPRPSADTEPSHFAADVDSQTFYLCLAALALVPRAQTYFSLQTFSVSELWRTLHEHPAQSSIGYDVLWTTASLAAYCALGGPSSVRKGILGMVSPGLALYLDDRRD